MRECWARSLGDCGTALSREHIVSNAILEPIVRVQGFSWCKDAPKPVPAERFKSWILCREHNGRLSPVDAEVQRFTETVKAYFEASMAFDRAPASFASLPIRRTLDGALLERWFCKTLVNIATVGDYECDVPVDSLLPHLFLGTPFPHPFGLHFAAKEGQTIHTRDDTITMEPLIEKNSGGRGHLVGGLFVFRGFHFVVLLPVPVSPIVGNTLPLATPRGSWEGMQLNWHNREITERKRFRSLDVLFQVISIQWS